MSRTQPAQSAPSKLRSKDKRTKVGGRPQSVRR
jgi:hypothetical protein